MNPNSAEPTTTPSKGRVWIFRILAATLAPLLVVLLLEGGLPLMGAGHPMSFWLPVDGQADSWTTNPRFGWRFFPRLLARAPVPTRVSGTPTDGVTRIVVAGGSAARGTPDSAYGFPRVLEALLDGGAADRPVEVINAAMTAINSHAVLPIVRDTARLQPDVLVVYLGNNEVVGPYGAGTVFRRFSPNLTAVRSAIALSGTRIGQLARRNTPQPAEWRGMEMFLEQTVAADDPRLDKVYEHFERNLTDIIEAAGTRVVLVTVGTNLRLPPFASLHRAGLSPDEQTQWQELFDAGLTLLGENPSQALERLTEAAHLDDRHAELHYHTGRALFALGRQDEARDALVRARDLDALRFRADSRIQQIIRQVAQQEASHDVVLVDAAADFEAELTDGLFYEHVHLTPKGNHRLATLVAEALVAQGLTPGSMASDAMPTAEKVSEVLALTPYDELELETAILRILSRPPFLDQFGHPKALELARQRIAMKRWNLGPDPLGASEALYARRLGNRPDDLEARRRYAEALQSQGRWADAADQWQELLDRLPGVLPWVSAHALCLAEIGGADEALVELQEMTEQWPNNPGLYVNLGTVHEKLGDDEAARKSYARALELNSAETAAHFNLATLDLRRGDTEAAEAGFRELLARRPDFASAHHNLGHVLEGQERLDDAANSYREAIRLRPETAGARNSLALVLAEMGRVEDALTEYRAALTADPGFPLTWFNAADLLFGLAQYEPAVRHYQEGLRRQGGNLQGRLNLARALLATGAETASAEALRQVLQREPGHKEASFRLAGLLATAQDSTLRDPATALQLAETAAGISTAPDPESSSLSQPSPEDLVTLAAVYRAVGRPGDAQAVLEQAAERARELGSETGTGIDRGNPNTP